MENQKNRRRNFFCNSLHRQTFLYFFLVAVIPAIIITLINYALILEIIGIKMDHPAVTPQIIASIADNSVTALIASSFGITFIMILFAHRLTLSIFGPIERITRELGEILKGSKKEHIKLRGGDKLAPLVNVINKLIDRYVPEGDKTS